MNQHDRYVRLRGHIVSAGFESGDRFVAGIWSHGPLCSMNDIMWVDPDGRRRLLAPTHEAAAFISYLYSFETVSVQPVDATWTASPPGLRLISGNLDLRLQFGVTLPVPFGRLRLPAVTRFVEGPVARRLMGVRTYGVARNGVREWYQADSVTQVRNAWATIDGKSLGSMRSLRPPLRVGFSEPPGKPSCVAVRPLLRDDTGGLQRVLQAGIENCL